MIIPISKYRRLFLAALSGLTIASLLAPIHNASSQVSERDLSFYHTHTGERLRVVYKRDGQYVAGELARLNRFLGDFRTGDQVDIDPALFDLMYEIRQELGGVGTYEVISAYRSLKTNEMLRRRSGGVARNSHHLTGTAIDIRLTGVETTLLRDTAIAMGKGGVGYYAKSDFVHIDTGRVRRW